MARKSLEQLEADLERARTVYAAADENLCTAYEAWEKELSKSLKDSDDIELLIKHAANIMVAYNRMNQIVSQKFPSLLLDGWTYWSGSHDNFYSHIGPEFSMKYREDPEEMAKTIESFCEFFKGHCEIDGEVYCDLMEKDLAERASYSMFYSPSTGMARVRQMTYGHETTPFSGTLRETLSYIAQNLWYGDGPDNDDEDPW